MAKDIKMKKEFPTWAAHLLLSLSTIGLTLGIVWLSPGTTIAPLLVEAFKFGLFVGVGLVMASVSALSLTPFALASIYFSFVGVLAGAAIVGLSVLAVKLAQTFRAPDNSEALQNDTENQQAEANEENKGFWNKIYDYLANIGLSASITAVASLYFPNLLVAVGVLPSFLSGMLVGILAIPFFASIETLGLLAIPFAAGGLLVSSLATGLTAYFMLRNDNTVSNENTEETKDSPDADNESTYSNLAMKKLSQSAKLSEEVRMDGASQDIRGTSQPMFGNRRNSDKYDKATTQPVDEVSCCNSGF